MVFRRIMLHKTVVMEGRDEGSEFRTSLMVPGLGFSGYRFRAYRVHLKKPMYDMSTMSRLHEHSHTHDITWEHLTGDCRKDRDQTSGIFRVIYGALIIRMGFWGPLYYTYNKEPPK